MGLSLVVGQTFESWPVFVQDIGLEYEAEEYLMISGFILCSNFKDYTKVRLSKYPTSWLFEDRILEVLYKTFRTTNHQVSGHQFCTHNNAPIVGALLRSQERGDQGHAVSLDTLTLSDPHHGSDKVKVPTNERVTGTSHGTTINTFM